MVIFKIVPVFGMYHLEEFIQSLKAVLSFARNNAEVLFISETVLSRAEVPSVKHCRLHGSSQKAGESVKFGNITENKYELPYFVRFIYYGRYLSGDEPVLRVGRPDNKISGKRLRNTGFQGQNHKVFYRGLTRRLRYREHLIEF